ncbi:hypothetical protein EW145_g7734, partial [Phellinidium pouzarii]
KQRHQSEPLPPRERASAEPPNELGPGRPKNDSAHALAETLTDASNAPHHSLRSSLDPQSRDTKETASRGAVAFPLTPTSAVGEAERAMATVTPAITNTNARCSPSDGLQAPQLSTSPVKMSQQPTINDALAFPPPPDVPVNNPSSANTVRAPPSHANGSASSSSSSRTMSHRVENLPIRPRHFQDQHFHDTHSAHYYSAHPSPPPIATLTHSPSLSSDRSSVSSPAPTILPPLTHPAQLQQQQSYLPSSGHRYAPAAQPGSYHHAHYYPSTVAPPDVFAAPAQSYAHSYNYAPPPPSHVPFHHATEMSISPSQQYSGNPYANVGAMYTHGGHGGGGSGGFTPIYTDDASTKLSDRVRRRCFNCCTTDTSTWRRSSLNPGKVLCNKCGLFERTHSRPRPDQFPHKRAPLQIPSHSPAHDNGLSAQSGNMEARQQMQSPHASTISVPQNLPPTTAHPSLGAAYSHPSALPQIQEWLRPNTGPATGGSPGSSSASAGPSRAASASSAGERHHNHAASAGNAPPGSNTGASATSASGPRSQGIGARLAKRSDSVNSDMLGTPPPQRVTQNLTPSPSPPPEGSRGGLGVGATGSPRAPPAGIDTGSV